MECRVKVQALIKLKSGYFAIGNGHLYNGILINDKEKQVQIQYIKTDSLDCLIELKDERLAFANKYSNQVIEIWNTTTRKSIFELMRHKQRVRCLVELSNGLLASGSDDKSILLWDLNTRQCLTCILTCSPICCIVELHNDRLSYPCDNRSIKLLYSSTHKCVKVLKWLSSMVSSMFILTDGRLVSGACDGIIQIWDVSSCKSSTLTGNNHKVSCIIELRNACLASASNEVIQLWNTTTYQLIKSYQVGNIVFCFVQFDDEHLIYGSDWGTLHLLSL